MIKIEFHKKMSIVFILFRKDGKEKKSSETFVYLKISKFSNAMTVSNSVGTYARESKGEEIRIR